MELSLIPNLAFAKIDVHTKCNIMFPNMYRPHHSPAIPRSVMVEFYEKIILPSLRDIDYEHVNHWPVSYNHAEAKAKDRQGQYHFSTVEIPPASLAPLRRAMRRRMRAFPHFSDSFFYHEVRGSKGGTHHDPSDNFAANDALAEIFSDIDFAQLTDEDLEHRWYVDCAFEVERPGHVVHWRSDMHHDILQYALPSAPDLAIRNLLKSESFKYDACAQLYDVAGFRAATTTIGRADKVRYINVYSTEKSLHYQLHRGVYNPIQVSELLPQGIKELHKRLDKWTEAFFEAIGNEDREPLQASARFEVRVPAQICAATCRIVPHDLIEAACVSYPSRTWW